MSDSAAFANLVWKGLGHAREEHDPYTCAHHALGVLLEEFREFEAEVFLKADLRDPERMRKELVDIAVVCWRAAEDLGLMRKEGAES